MQIKQYPVIVEDFFITLIPKVLHSPLRRHLSSAVRALSSRRIVRVNSVVPTYGVTHTTFVIFRYVQLK